MKILGICGSLRDGSFNRMLLRQALSLVEQEAWATDTFDLSAIPLYNADLDGPEKPEAVTRLISGIKAADGLLIATPEYNYSIPGLLKNALDWASRPAYQSVLKNKPVAVLTASIGMVGGARAQVHLRDVLAGTLARVCPASDFLLAAAGKAFSPDGSLKDETTAAVLKKYMDDYIAWAITR